MPDKKKKIYTTSNKKEYDYRSKMYKDSLDAYNLYKKLEDGTLQYELEMEKLKKDPIYIQLLAKQSYISNEKRKIRKLYNLDKDWEKLKTELTNVDKRFPLSKEGINISNKINELKSKRDKELSTNHLSLFYSVDGIPTYHQIIDDKPFDKTPYINPKHSDRLFWYNKKIKPIGSSPTDSRDKESGRYNVYKKPTTPIVYEEKVTSKEEIVPKEEIVNKTPTPLVRKTKTYVPHNMSSNTIRYNVYDENGVIIDADRDEAYLLKKYGEDELKTWTNKYNPNRLPYSPKPINDMKKYKRKLSLGSTLSHPLFGLALQAGQAVDAALPTNKDGIQSDLSDAIGSFYNPMKGIGNIVSLLSTGRTMNANNRKAVYERDAEMRRIEELDRINRNTAALDSYNTTFNAGDKPMSIFKYGGTLSNIKKRILANPKEYNPLTVKRAYALGGEFSVPDENSEPINENAELVTNNDGTTQGSHEQGDDIPLTHEGQEVADVEPGEVIATIGNKQYALSKRLGIAQKYIELSNYKKQLIEIANKEQDNFKKNNIKRELDKIDLEIAKLPQIQEAMKQQMGYSSGNKLRWGNKLTLGSGSDDDLFNLMKDPYEGIVKNNVKTEDPNFPTMSSKDKPKTDWADVARIGIPILEAATNQFIINKTPKLPTVPLQKYISLNKEMNIKPQIRTIREGYKDMREAIGRNTSSSNTALGRIQDIKNKEITTEGDVRNKAENYKNEMINKETSINFEVDNKNQDRRYQDAMDYTKWKAGKLGDTQRNITQLLNRGIEGLNNLDTKKYQEEQLRVLGMQHGVLGVVGDIIASGLRDRKRIYDLVRKNYPNYTDEQINTILNQMNISK